MLRELRVANLVLIREASLGLAPGLNVLTGETGAGKTIVAQAVSLLLGGKTDAALVGPAGSEAYVEAAFANVPPELMPDGIAGLVPDDEDELLLARRVGADGRSRALVFGRACARSDLETLGGGLKRWQGCGRLCQPSDRWQGERNRRAQKQCDLSPHNANVRARRASWRLAFG
jgi:DNA repair protein RecN (Recombination protein N)